MRKNHLATWVVLLAFIAGVPAVCAAQSVRVIPKGTLSVFENGKPVGEFKSEVPLPQGASLVCSGECLVQGEKFQLLACDKTEFSLAKNGKEWVLTVKSGTVRFSMSESTKLVFVTPKGRYEVAKAIPANGLVRGCIVVTAAGTEFAADAGFVLYLASAGGVQEIPPKADAYYACACLPAGAAIPTGAIVAGGAVAAGAGLGIAAALGAFSSSKPPVSPY